MQYSRLGNTGLLVSRLGFGAMTFGSPESPMTAVANLHPAAAHKLVQTSP